VKRTRGIVVAGVALASLLSSGCSSQHGEYGSGAYIFGGLFLLIGLAAGFGLIMGRR